MAYRNTESFRSLTNYKLMHRATAQKKGVVNELRDAQTLTEARKILFGHKKKNKKIRSAK